MRGADPSRIEEGFLPDFCDIRTVFVVVLAGELLAVVLALMAGPVLDFWHTLGGTSLFVQWVGLATAALLCLARGRLAALGPAAAAAVTLGVVLAVTAGLSLTALWLLDPSLPPSGVGEHGWEFLGRNVAISALVGAVTLRYFFVQQRWRQNLAREAEARFQALQSRIRPHFLFNSMNTIASLTRSDPALAERVVEDLADLFRVSLGDARVPTTLAGELEVCRRYLEIEALRLGDRLAVHWEVEGLPGEAQIPALTVQPLVENAVYHGVEPAPEGGWVRVAGRREGNTVTVKVENSVPPPGISSRDGNRLARDNVRQRLEAFFGAAAQVEEASEGDRYRVTLRFPRRGSVV